MLVANTTYTHYIGCTYESLSLAIDFLPALGVGVLARRHRHSIHIVPRASERACRAYFVVLVYNARAHYIAGALCIEYIYMTAIIASINTLYKTFAAREHAR